MHRQESARMQKRRCLDVCRLVTLSYARRQNKRPGALDTNSFRIAINYAALFQRPLVTYEVGFAAAAA